MCAVREIVKLKIWGKTGALWKSYCRKHKKQINQKSIIFQSFLGKYVVTVPYYFKGVNAGLKDF